MAIHRLVSDNSGHKLIPLPAESGNTTGEPPPGIWNTARGYGGYDLYTSAGYCEMKFLSRSS
jgi:hypothetical protein